MKSRLTALIAVIAFAAVTVAAGCGSSNDDNSSSGTTAAGGALTATPGINVAKDRRDRQCGGIRRPAERPALDRVGRDLSARWSSSGRATTRP